MTQDAWITLARAHSSDHCRIPGVTTLTAGRLIQFPQLTMPLIAALTPRTHLVSHTDEIVEPVRFDVRADLIGITAPTPSALHAYSLAREFRRRGVPVVIGGPHATALPEEAAAHADAWNSDFPPVQQRGQNSDRGLVEVRREKTLRIPAGAHVARGTRGRN
jgi:B12 binding protein